MSTFFLLFQLFAPVPALADVPENLPEIRFSRITELGRLENYDLSCSKREEGSCSIRKTVNHSVVSDQPISLKWGKRLANDFLDRLPKERVKKDPHGEEWPSLETDSQFTWRVSTADRISVGVLPRQPSDSDLNSLQAVLGLENNLSLRERK